MTELWRLSGAGNDFLAVVPPGEPPTETLVRRWCRRGVSLGADGVLHLEPGDPVSLRYWNADGTPADLCLNGTRCAAQLLFHLGWREESAEIRTGAGTLRARRAGPSEVALEVPILPERPRPVEIDLGDGAIRGWFLEVGVPHLVVPWEGDLTGCPVARLGPPLRSHPAVGPSGANVDFVHLVGRRDFEIRSYERGVESETLACGTGVLAAAAVGLHREELELPTTARTRGGFDLEISGETDGGAIRHWSLRGDARVLARIEVRDEAVDQPARPDTV
ncbi:MAG: diaminopimelate epimerase [Thermoanaerobaculia bacterium]|nr:diaminopimelate epimerase [Thermoanaerobaculia bacterium]